MGLTDYLILAVVALVLTLSIRYIIKAKKAGVKCVGCSACNCSGDAKHSCQCHHH